jgi:hypothetical protein
MPTDYGKLAWISLGCLAILVAMFLILGLG